MMSSKITKKKIEAILKDVEEGVGTVYLQAKHRVSLQSMYKIPEIRTKLFGRATRKREIQIREVVALSKKGIIQDEIGKKIGISTVTVRKHLVRAQDKCWITKEERLSYGKNNHSRKMAEVWAAKRKMDDENGKLPKEIEVLSKKIKHDATEKYSKR